MIALGIIAGPIYDRGYLRSLVAVGAVLLVLGMLLTGTSSRYWQIMLAQGIVVGLGSGCVFLPSIAVLPQYFEKRRALATGLSSSGSAIGIAIPSLATHLATFDIRQVGYAFQFCSTAFNQRSVSATRPGR